MKLYGPFSQLLTFAHLPLAGPLRDEQLHIISEAAVVVDGDLNGGGTLVAVGTYTELKSQYRDAAHYIIDQPTVALPGLIDCHTHLCWDGSRANDFALRNGGASYLQLAEAGGGIKYTVAQTRTADDPRLLALISARIDRLAAQGITTIECKSGYGLSVEEELRHLALIDRAFQSKPTVDHVATCLAAHVCPPEFAGQPAVYLQHLAEHLLPQLAPRIRVDAFAEPSTFWGEPLQSYLQQARARGHALTLHADQFTAGGAALACQLGAQSADHLEHTDAAGIAALAKSAKTDRPTIAVALPGASLGLGEPHAPARKLLDAGAALAIATDWNPGSAPQGHLLAQATILAAAEKLSNAEVFAAITFRAAQALGLQDRGRLVAGQRADVSFWPTDNYQDITWSMGSMAPLLPATIAQAA